MVAQIGHNKCAIKRGEVQSLCVEACPDSALRVKGDRVVGNGFICEDCNEYGYVFPDKAISVSWDKVTFQIPRHSIPRLKRPLARSRPRMLSLGRRGGNHEIKQVGPYLRGGKKP